LCGHRCRQIDGRNAVPVLVRDAQKTDVAATTTDGGKSGQALVLSRVVTEKGKGYGTQAIYLILQIVFDELNAHRLWLDVRCDNMVAQSLYKAAGFIVEGKMRECFKVDGQFESMLMMALLRTEYVHV